jgi:hypothetical protein
MYGQLVGVLCLLAGWEAMRQVLPQDSGWYRRAEQGCPGRCLTSDLRSLGGSQQKPMTGNA